MAAINNLIGRRFGRLLVTHYGGMLGGAARWVCLCDCGARKTVRRSALTSGDTKSCGCIRKENAAIQRRSAAIKAIQHGHTKDARVSPEYQSWAHMISRCAAKPSDYNYQYYGARGVVVCKRWRNSFAAFLQDMGPRPAGTTLDRFPNPAGNYEPGNCRWATKSQQRYNRRKLGGLSD